MQVTKENRVYRKFHALAGGLALLTVLAFWTSTILSELSGDLGLIARVKAGVLMGMVVLVPCLMATGGSGFHLAKSWRGPVVEAKKRRMMAAALNGVVVLVPSALLLAFWSAQGRLDAWFSFVQALELVAGAVNIVLLGLNLRDGLRMRKRLSTRSPAADATAG